jgi:hypothetical protein
MSKKPRALATLALVALISAIGAGCGSSAPSETTGTASPAGTSGTSGAARPTSTSSTPREKAMKFSRCMRDNGIKDFPDPDPSGELTIDAIANGAAAGSSLDPSTAAFKKAIGACKDLQPPGFTGHKRSAGEQKYALKFAQCMRDNGIKDFPDPDPDGALIDTNRIPSAAGRGALSIPGFTAAQDKCGAAFADELGLGNR